jgi:serine/threonine protein kinase
MMINLDDLPQEAKDLLNQFPEFQPASFNDSGANGFVLMGRHNVLHKEVALKIYYHEENEVDQEPSLSAAINHDNVLKVYDARRLSKGCSFYMMPVANYGDLTTYLSQYSLSAQLAHQLLCQLLSGLSALHSHPNNLVHRDLKPENLLVHDDRLVIADFGSVRRVSNKTGRAPASRHSILYRPPEAFGPNAYFDYSSDTYQAGIIGYRLFGGTLSNNLTEYLKASELKDLKNIQQGDYFEASKYVDSCIEKRISSGTLLNWRSVPLFVPARVIRILKRAASKAGSHYNNVSEFLAELQKSKATLPDWIAAGETWELTNWKGKDYQLLNLGGNVEVRKRKHGNAKFIRDSSLSGGTLADAYARLAHHARLP